MKKLTIEEWKEIGDLSKKINTDMKTLTKLSMNRMDLKRIRPLAQSVKYLNKFRSDAENEMFSKDMGDTKIFYGNSIE